MGKKDRKKVIKRSIQYRELRELNKILKNPNCNGSIKEEANKAVKKLILKIQQRDT